MRFKLLNGASSEGVASRRDNRAAIVEKSLSNFGRCRGFSRAVHPNQHDDNGDIASIDEPVNGCIKVPVAGFKQGL